MLGAVLAGCGPVGAAERPAVLIETPMFADKVASRELPPVERRIPESPSVVTFEGDGLAAGRHGGTLRTLSGGSKDIRLMVVYGYARMVGYDADLELRPDILESIDVADGRSFTLSLRKGHKWSDGHPFTAEDFRYYWEDMAIDPEVSPIGPPRQMLVDGQRPRFEVIDEVTVRYTWSAPNPFFLPALAGARPLDIYRPAHYLKRFHARHVHPVDLARLVGESGQRNWVALHFRKDRMYRNDNPDLPSLQPWVIATKPPAQRFVFVRNPYYHRVDGRGRQLPYIDRVAMTIASAKLVPAKAGAGEADLQARNLQFANYTFLKQGEKRNGYTVRLWQSAKGSQMALFPNLNIGDAVWRSLFRSADFRRALSLATDRHEINQVIYFGLALESNNTVLPKSPLYRPEYAMKWAEFDTDRANRMLDGMGLAERDGQGIRLLPDGRPMHIVVETAGEDTEQTDILQLIHDSWLKVGIKLFIKPLQREVFRNRIFAGSALMSVWSGLENGIPTPDLSPRELAPTSQQQLQWPKWGQYYETMGKAGQPVVGEPAARLAHLNTEWRRAESRSRRTEIWHDMLRIHADQAFNIGLVRGVPQPVVVGNRLRNVPTEGIYNWDPGAFFGIHRPDTFWFADGPAQVK